MSLTDAQSDAWESNLLALNEHKNSRSAQNMISLEKIVNDELEAV